MTEITEITGPNPQNGPRKDPRIQAEESSQRLTMAFIVVGIFFMLLPGTFLGVWNLISISSQHTMASLSPAWMQAHGQAQVFGWIGSFIFGIGFYSLTKMQSTRDFPAVLGWTTWWFWSLGMVLHWGAMAYAWHWRLLLPLSSALEIAAWLLFYLAVRKHQPATGKKPEAWMGVVVGATFGFLLAILLSSAANMQAVWTDVGPAATHAFDQKLITVYGWAMLVPMIWGFNARWLPIFIGLRNPKGPLLLLAYGTSVVGVGALFTPLAPAAEVLFLLATVLSILALHVWQRAERPAKLVNIHPSFPAFVRVTYLWLLVASLLGIAAQFLDEKGGYWGASRHALTVGFTAAMVFAIGQRVLPAFCGMRLLWSKRLMLASLLLLNLGCLLRVSMEPLAYEGIWHPAWDFLPISAVTELTAVGLFATNILLTLLQPPAHLATQPAPSRAF